MNIRPYLIGSVAVIACFLSGCVNSRTLTFASGNSVAPVYEQGVPLVKSQKTSGVVVRILTSEFNNETSGLPSLFVAAYNGSTSSFDFSTDNISAQSGGKAVKIYSFEQMQKRIRNEAALMAFAVAMSAAGASMQASLPQTSYTSGTINAYGAGGYARANYGATTTTYNPTAVAAAQAQINSNMMSHMSMVASSRDLQLSGTAALLRRNTVAPGAAAGGVVKLHGPDIEAGKPLRVIVNLSGEMHEFLFEVGR